MSLCSRLDVTSVKLLGEYILAGIGSFLQAYEKNSGTFLQRLQVLEGQRIYGIVSNQTQNKCIVFGGKQVTVLKIERNVPGSIELSLHFQPIHCDDWLQSAVWTSDDSIAVLTSHNVVQHWDCNSLTLTARQPSVNNSVLYSGSLLVIEGDVLVLAGTVFSEVLVSFSSNDELLQTLKGHKGVIFSVACDLDTQTIASTSDDRSLCIWKPKFTLPYSAHTTLFWKNVEFSCTHRVFGHLARVMRCCIIEDRIISAGEDSTLCYWSFSGQLVKKTSSHQNGCIWSLDANKRDVVSGGSDGGLFIHPLYPSEYVTKSLKVSHNNPKKIAFTARNNLVVLTEDSELHYYDTELNISVSKYDLDHESTYILLSMSPCKQIIATIDMCGNLDVFTELCKGEPNIINIVNVKLNLGKVLSMQWAGNRHLILCNDVGEVTVLSANGSTSDVYANFTLPPCKERWLTSSATDCSNKLFALGDRCGNIHIYKVGNRKPYKTFNKVHGRYGATSINIVNNTMVTTGRDGSVKHFNISNNDEVKYMTSKEINFDWVEKFLDKDKNIVCGFQERVFAVYDLRFNVQMINVPCGGGHRAWDAVRYIEKYKDNFEEYIKFVYVKNSNINEVIFQLSNVVSRNIVKGIQAKELNCMKVYKTNLDPDFRIYFSGGEDTTVRVTTNNLNNLQDFNDEVIYKHLSNVRTLRTFKLDDDKLFLITGGGRAEIRIKLVHIVKENNAIQVKVEALIDHMIKGTDKQRRGNQNWRNCTVDFDPETRIMDLDIIKRNEETYTVVTGCSDAILRIFEFIYNAKETTFKELIQSNHHKNCILKTLHFKIKDKVILITTTTRGLLTLWDITDIDKELKPFLETTTNKCGINSIAIEVLNDTDILIATGGDDNAIHIISIDISTIEDVKVTYRMKIENFHHCQITGLEFLSDNYLVSTSIDQRVTLSRWDKNGSGLTCEFAGQVYTDVADVQGLCVVDENSSEIVVCVFGKGMELLKFVKPL